MVLLIPEVNLADWETRQPPVWLPGDGTSRWHLLYRRALHQESLDDARSLLELDGGACPSTWRLLSRLARARGDAEEARRAALAEVDAAAYPTLAFLSAPQATTAARELLTDAARRHGFAAGGPAGGLRRAHRVPPAGPPPLPRLLPPDQRRHPRGHGRRRRRGAEPLRHAGRGRGLARPPLPSAASRGLPRGRGHGPVRRRDPHRPSPAPRGSQGADPGALVRGRAGRLARRRGRDARPPRSPLRPLPGGADRGPATQPGLALPPDSSSTAGAGTSWTPT